MPVATWNTGSNGSSCYLPIVPLTALGGPPNFECCYPAAHTCWSMSCVGSHSSARHWPKLKSTPSGCSYSRSARPSCATPVACASSFAPATPPNDIRQRRSRSTPDNPPSAAAAPRRKLGGSCALYSENRRAQRSGWSTNDQIGRDSIPARAPWLVRDG